MPQEFTDIIIKNPTKVEYLKIILMHCDGYQSDSDGNRIPGSSDIQRGIEYSIILADEDGVQNRDEKLKGDLVPYLSSAEITSLQTFMDKMLVKAQKLL